MIGCTCVVEQVEVRPESAAGAGAGGRARPRPGRRPCRAGSASEEVSGGDPPRAEAPAFRGEPGRGGAVATSSVASPPRSPLARSFAPWTTRWLAAVPCVSQTAYMRCAECLDEHTCGVRLAMKKVRDATARILESHHVGVGERADRAHSASVRLPSPEVVMMRPPLRHRVVAPRTSLEPFGRGVDAGVACRRSRKHSSSPSAGQTDFIHEISMNCTQAYATCLEGERLDVCNAPIPAGSPARCPCGPGLATP